MSETLSFALAQTLSSKQFESGRVLVDNEAEQDLTVVTINERKDSTAALLDVASAMTGIGVVIHEAIIQVLFPPVTCVDLLRQCAPPLPAVTPMKYGRVTRQRCWMQYQSILTWAFHLS